MKNFNVYVGSTTGSLKGVTVGKDNCGMRTVFHNIITNKADISNKNEITCMEWSEDNPEHLILSFKSKIKLFDTSISDFVFETRCIADTIRGAFSRNGAIYAATATGVVKRTNINSVDCSWTEFMATRGLVDCMECSSLNQNVIATGGKDNDLKLWSFESKEMIFNAKNIKPDELQIQAPIWISGIVFSKTDERVSTCSRHGYIRSYDPRLPQRRPVFNAYLPDSVFTCLSGTACEEQLIAGNGAGEIHLIDMRAKKPFHSKFKDGCGAIKGIICPQDSNAVLSVSLDRHFRIHDLKTRKLIYKDYMMSRLTRIAAKSPFIIEQFEDELKAKIEKDEEETKAKKMKTSKKALDKIFQNMEPTGDHLNAKKLCNFKVKKNVRKLSLHNED